MNYKTFTDGDQVETDSPIIITWQQTDSGSIAGGMVTEDGLALRLQQDALAGKTIKLVGESYVPITWQETKAEVLLCVRSAEILESSIDWEATRQNNVRSNKNTYIMLRNGRWAIWNMKPADAGKRLGRTICGRDRRMHVARGEYYMRHEVLEAHMLELPCGGKWIMRLKLRNTPRLPLRSLRINYGTLSVKAVEQNPGKRGNLWSSAYIIDAGTAAGAVKNFASGMLTGFSSRKEDGLIILTPGEEKTDGK